MNTPHLPGKFVWFEFLTQDIDKAIEFYDGLFGWHSARVPMDGAEPYPMIKNGDQAIGGYRKGPPGVKSHWASYLSVPDVDASHGAAVAAGCRVMMGPTSYYVLKQDGRPRAGLCQSVNSKAKSMWLPYVAVPDCDGTARKATALGGEMVTPPGDIPGIGRFGIAVDTMGAPVAFIAPKNA